MLTTRSGGLGLNLIGADTVIIHDSDFNPTMDRQAEDRCHWIGQKREVTVYKLITKNTVDEKIFDISQKKMQLGRDILETDEMHAILPPFTSRSFLKEVVQSNTQLIHSGVCCMNTSFSLGLQVGYFLYDISGILFVEKLALIE